MNIDLELREILDKIINDAHSVKNLRAKFNTWKKLKEHNSLNSFNDFVIGDLNGQIKCSYATYNGKMESELENTDKEFLDKMLLRRVYGLKPVINDFLEKDIDC